MAAKAIISFMLAEGSDTGTQRNFAYLIPSVVQVRSEVKVQPSKSMNTNRFFPFTIRLQAAMYKMGVV